jgi:hypothetical protein
LDALQVTFVVSANSYTAYQKNEDTFFNILKLNNLQVGKSVLILWSIVNVLLFHACVIFLTCKSVTPLHWRPLQTATISKMESDNSKALQNRFKARALELITF